MEYRISAIGRRDTADLVVNTRRIGPRRTAARPPHGSLRAHNWLVERRSDQKFAGSSRVEAGATSQKRTDLPWRAELGGLDRAVYAAVAGTATPRIDGALQRLTSTADNSKLWIAISLGLAIGGGPEGRKAALTGMTSIGLASVSVNQGFKRVLRRQRPDRDKSTVPQTRQVPMPASTSFPSGHSASAFAFASGVGSVFPLLSPPLHVAAAIVAYTRVHSGVHYPGDVVVGSLVGIACGQLAPRLVQRGANYLAQHQD